MNPGIVALLTDFGLKDAYVGVMKAVMLSRYPDLRLVDLCHQVRPHAILSGAYLLYSAWDYLPAGSCICAVVDPGVGGSRGALLAQEGGRYLIAPDNGLISLLARIKPDLEVFALNTGAVRELFPPPEGRERSHTFHGRDLFAPAAALCAEGQAERVRGHRLEPVLLPEAWPRSEGARALAGAVLHADRFGNCITSIHRMDLESRFPAGDVAVQVPRQILHGLRSTYSDVAKGEALALIGGSGFLEISVREGDAAECLGLAGGATVRVRGVGDSELQRGD